jgi:hypothetical protein
MKKKILALCCGGVLLVGTLGGVAVGVNSNPAQIAKEQISLTKFAQKQHVKMGKHHGVLKGNKQEVFKEALTQLVKDGTIDQKKADQVQTFLDKQTKEREERFSNLVKATPEERKALKEKWFAQKKAGIKKANLNDELVTNKILTQKQADAFKAKIKEITIQKHQQKITGALKDLVTKKTINQEQADKINNAFEVSQKERTELFAKIKGMTKAERKDYFTNNKPNFVNPVAKLVEEGIITKDQGSAVSEALGCCKGHKKGLGKGFNKGFTKEFYKGFNIGL